MIVLPTMAGVLAARQGGLASRVGTSVMGQTGTAADPITWPGSPAIGDLAIVMTFDGVGASSVTINGGTGGQASWTKSQLNWTNYGFQSTVQWKLLGAGDLAGLTMDNTTGAGGLAVLMIYRGPTVLTIKSSNSGQGGSQLSLLGFTKSAFVKALVSIVQDRDATAGFQPPGTFQRLATGNSGFSGGGADILNPSNYVDGTTVTWILFSSSFDQVGWLMELT